MLELVTPLIITLNEAPNIRRTLEKLTWAQRIVIIDSGSTDGTLDIINSYPQAEVVQNSFRSFADQCNFGVEQVATPWVLSLDADYKLSDNFIKELKSLSPIETVAGYRSSFVYCIHGRRLRGSLYPPRTVLYRKGRARYHDEGHGHRVLISGDVMDMIGPIFHDDRKPLMRWVASQRQYAQAEARYLWNRRDERLKLMDRLRLACWPAPFVALFFTLFAKGTILDGWAGWYYALQRVAAEALISLEILDQHLCRSSKEPDDNRAGAPR